jgi:hypothetical protein
MTDSLLPFSIVAQEVDYRKNAQVSNWEKPEWRMNLLTFDLEGAAPAQVWYSDAHLWWFRVPCLFLPVPRGLERNVSLAPGSVTSWYLTASIPVITRLFV